MFLIFSYNHHHIASLLILLVIVFGCCNVVRIVNIIIFKHDHQNFVNFPRLSYVLRIGTMIKVVAMLIYVNFYMYMAEAMGWNLSNAIFAGNESMVKMSIPCQYFGTTCHCGQNVNAFLLIYYAETYWNPISLKCGELIPDIKPSIWFETDDFSNKGENHNQLVRGLPCRCLRQLQKMASLVKKFFHFFLCINIWMISLVNLSFPFFFINR